MRCDLEACFLVLAAVDLDISACIFLYIIASLKTVYY